jgi:hypothetical protein
VYETGALEEAAFGKLALLMLLLLPPPPPPLTNVSADTQLGSLATLDSALICETKHAS